MLHERTALEAQVQRLQQRIEVLDRFPTKDPYKNGTALRFKLNLPASGTFGSTSQRYTYIGFRANGRWFVTGKDIAGGWRWEQFVGFLGDRLAGDMVELGNKAKMHREIDTLREEANKATQKMAEVVTQPTGAVDAPGARDLFRDMCSAYGAMTMYRPVLDRIFSAAGRAVAGNHYDRAEWWAAKRRFDALYHPATTADPERSTES
jgi:hypothetical protein